MNSHKNAKLTARGREEMVRRLGAKSVAAVAADYGLSVRTVRKWKHRYAVGGVKALSDASSRPKRCRCSLTKEDMARIRELRMGHKTADESALLPGLCRSTVFRALRNWAFPGLPPWRLNQQFTGTSGSVPEICSMWI